MAALGLEANMLGYHTHFLAAGELSVTGACR
jgi:hypothetical protein